MGLLQLSKSLEDREISPVELVEQSLAKIRRENPSCNAFITVCEEQALADAAAAEKEIKNGSVKSPLHGVPVAVKDVIFTKGIRTTMGSKLYKDFVPDQDAAVIKKLRDAGAIIIGKTHTHEFAYGPIGDRSFFGPARNPYNPEKITGGSSSGSAAAIAADMVSVALGTDTGGSVRIPASACGVVGMKPTYGLVSTDGVYHTAYTLDHVGPMTKTVRDNAVLLHLFTGNKYLDLLEEDISGKVIGLPSFFFKNIDSEVADAINQVIIIYESLGASVVEVDVKGIEEIAKFQKITIQAEAYATHRDNLSKHSLDYDREVYERLASGQNMPADEYIVAQQQKEALITHFNQVFEKADVLLTPTIPMLPTDIGQREVNIGNKTEPVKQALLRLTSPINYTGNPALSVPCGFSRGGLPIGFQLLGIHGKEALLYQIGHAYERIGKK